MGNMSYSFKLWSHPGKLLKDHINNVLQNGRSIYAKFNQDENLAVVFDLILLLHDLGKASSYFQKYIHAIDKHDKNELSDDEFERIKYEIGDHKNHSRISAIWTFIAVKRKFNDPVLALISYITVLYHHGHLLDLDQMLEFNNNQITLVKNISEQVDYEEYQQILNKKGYTFLNLNHERFIEEIESFWATRNYRRKWCKQIKEKIRECTFFNTSLAFSTLLSADKGECIFDGIVYQRDEFTLPANLIDTYKSIKFKNTDRDGINKWREKVYESASCNIEKQPDDQRFYSINVPTGIGKTLTAVNCALKLLHRESSFEKIIYCLPFTSVIDQNAGVLEDVLELNNIEPNSENLLINHHLADIAYKTKTDQGEIDDNKSEFLITQFESDLNITTFYQLLYGIFSRKNRDLRKLHSFANSVIILDEVQSIPSKYWPLIKEIFKQISELLNITFIFVTATLPMIFSEEEGEIEELVSEKEEVFEALNRITLNTSLLDQKYNLDEFISLLEKDISQNSDRSFLVILNTVKASKTVFKGLQKRSISNLTYLSTNIPPYERFSRINDIRNKDDRFVVVSTQLVEAGVDIDLDVVYRDLAPLDSIFQSAGRCNRNMESDKMGEVKIVSLVDKDNHGKRFAGYIYDAPDLDLTQQLLSRKKDIPESDFLSLGNEYYRRIYEDNVANFDDSDFILEQIGQLNYSEAFDINKNKKAFELIEGLPTTPAFIAYEDDAKELLQEYDELIDTDFDNKFEKKRAIKKIYKKMSQFMVSVPQKYAYQTEQPFYVISDEQFDFSYDKDVGIEYEAGSSLHF